MTAPAAPAGHAALLDQGRIDELLDLFDFDALMELLQGLVAELRARPGVIAAQCDSGDLLSARKTAHYLKGPALGIGAARLAGLCSAIETAEPQDIAALTVRLRAAAGETEQALRALMAA